MVTMLGLLRAAVARASRTKRSRAPGRLISPSRSLSAIFRSRTGSWCHVNVPIPPWPRRRSIRYRPTESPARSMWKNQRQTGFRVEFSDWKSPARLPRSRPGCHYTAKRGRSAPERPHIPVPHTSQNERTRVVERAFRSSLPLPRSGSTIRHAFTANVAHGASGSNGRTYRVSGWQDDTRNPPEHLVGRRLSPIARRLGARRDQERRADEQPSRRILEI